MEFTGDSPQGKPLGSESLDGVLYGDVRDAGYAPSSPYSSEIGQTRFTLRNWWTLKSLGVTIGGTLWVTADTLSQT